MKGIASDYQCENAKNISHALELLEQGAIPIAGGTDLMVLFEAGNLAAGNYVNLWPLKDLKTIVESDEHIEIGALCTYSQIRNFEAIREHLPLLVEAAKVTGAIAIQNRGTLGGNIVNASPAADSPPALLVYDTQIELVSSEGKRWVDYPTFHKDYKKMDRKANELLTRVRIKKQNYTDQHYRKVGTRQAQAISKVCFAALKLNNEFRLAFGSVAPIPLRCLKTEAYLNEPGAEIPKALEILRTEIAPIDDIRSNKNYRTQVALNLLKAYLT